MGVSTKMITYDNSVWGVHSHYSVIAMQRLLGLQLNSWLRSRDHTFND